MTQLTTLNDDPFFRLTGDTEWNACIGPQGHEENYVDGYMEAALYLSRAVLEKQLHISRDTLVLPILYNARHAIELALKYVTKQLCEAGLVSEQPEMNHRIEDLFQQLGKIGFKDCQFQELAHRLSPFVQSLAAIDADGQELRYAQNKKREISLKNRALANLQVVHASLQELSDVLQSLKRRTRIWCEEHQTDTFTNRFSRNDLMRIAQRLAEEPTLRGTQFEREANYSEIREELKRNYSVGNRPLDEAIKVIKNHRQMGSLLGIEFHLKSLTDEKINFISARWTKRHPPRPPGEPSTCILKSSDLSTEMRRFLDGGDQEVTEELLRGLSRDEIVDWHTVFYLGRDGYRCEDYDWLYEQHQQELRLYDDLWEQVDHLVSKTNLLRELVRGLRLLGRRNLADEILASRPDLFPSQQ